HGRVAETLERLTGDQARRPEDIEALGHHFGLSSDKGKSIGYLVAAGDWARGVYANDDAVRHYERALAARRESESREGELLSVRERLGDLLAPMGRRDAAIEHYEAVLAGHQGAADRPAQARMHRKVGGLMWEAGDRSGALGRFQAGLDLLEDAEDVEL